MKEKKNLMSCFDDIGVDFLSAWKPGNLSSVPNLDFECSQPSVSGKTFKIPNNFDLEIDFGTQSGLSSKLSSFDIDFDFLKSPKHIVRVKENRREPRAFSETSKDSLESNTENDASAPSGQEQQDLDSKTRVVEGKSSMKCRNQIELVRASTTADCAETLAWGSQSNMPRAYLDSNGNRTIEDVSNDMIEGTAHGSSSPKSLGPAVLQRWQKDGEQTQSAPQTTEQLSGEGATGCAFQLKEQDKNNVPPVQALSYEKDKTVIKIVDNQDATVQQRSTEGALKGNTENNVDLHSNVLVANVRETTETTDLRPREYRSEKTMFVVGPFETATESQINNEEVGHTNKSEEVPCEIADAAQSILIAGVIPTRDAESKAALVNKVQEVPTHWTDLLPSIVDGQKKVISAEKNFEVEEEFPASEQIVDLPVQGVTPRNSMDGNLRRNSQNTKRPATEERKSSDLASGKTNEDGTRQPTTERKSNVKRSPQPAKVSRSFFTKDLSKKDMMDSNDPPKTAGAKDRIHKDNISTAFKSLKPTQVSSLRTSRSHALPPLRSGKQMEDPSTNANGENSFIMLKPPVDVKTIPLETPIPHRTRTFVRSKRGPPEEEAADAQEDHSKRPKVQDMHRAEADSHQFKSVKAGQGKYTSASSLALEKLSLPKHASSIGGQRQSQSRVPASINKLGSQLRFLEHELGHAAARVKTHGTENLPAISKLLCARSPPRNHNVDTANSEAMKSESAMNHKLKSDRHNQKKSDITTPHSHHENTIENLTGAMNKNHEVVKNKEPQKTHGNRGSQLPLRDNQMDSTMEGHEKQGHHKLRESYTQPRPDDTMGQGYPNETTFDRISKTTSDCSVELDEILSMLKQKQRNANALLAEVMAHNAKLKYLLDSKNQGKIMSLQKSIEEKLEEVKMQATGNQAKRCKLCKDKREGEAAA